jgi:hypothetical protein
MWIFDFLFGCRHADLSRVFTISGQTYRVCCTCGSRFSYSLANMRMGRRFAEIPQMTTIRPAPARVPIRPFA